MKWINAIGLILQFIAFWCAAPELLGQATMLRMQKGLEKLLSRIPLIFFTIVILGYGIFFGVRGVLKGIEASQTHNVTAGEMWSFYISLGIATLLYGLLMFFYKPLRRYLNDKVAVPLVENMIHQTSMRRQALALGAILFTLGFMLQLLAILFSN